MAAFTFSESTVWTCSNGYMEALFDTIKKSYLPTDGLVKAMDEAIRAVYNLEVDRMTAERRDELHAILVRVLDDAESGRSEKLTCPPSFVPHFANRVRELMVAFSKF